MKRYIRAFRLAQSILIALLDDHDSSINNAINLILDYIPTKAARWDIANRMWKLSFELMKCNFNGVNDDATEHANLN